MDINGFGEWFLYSLLLLIAWAADSWALITFMAALCFSPSHDVLKYLLLLHTLQCNVCMIRPSPLADPTLRNLGNFKVEQKEASHIGIQFISGLFHPWKNNWFIKFFISWWNCMISRKRLTRIVDSDTVYKLRLCVWIVHVTKILHAYIYRRKCLAMADWLNPRQWKLIGGLLFCKRANGGSLVSSNDYLRGSRYKRLPL